MQRVPRIPLWLRLRSVIRAPHPNEHLAAPHFRSGQEKAAELVGENRRTLAAEIIREVGSGDRRLSPAADDEAFHKLVLSIELQVLWGLFSEHEKGFDAPTNGYDRVMLSLIGWMCERYDYSWADALNEVKKAEYLYNNANPLFDVLAMEGRKAYRSPRADIFVRAIAALNEASFAASAAD